MQAHKQYTTVRSISTKVVSGKGRELSLQTKASVEMLTKAVSFTRRICSDQSHAYPFDRKCMSCAEEGCR